jgi:hypothetical protein
VLDYCKAGGKESQADFVTNLAFSVISVNFQYDSGDFDNWIPICIGMDYLNNGKNALHSLHSVSTLRRGL